MSDNKDNTTSKPSEDKAVITAKQFADIHGFSPRDKAVVKKMYGNKLNTSEAWHTELEAKFSYELLS